MDVTEQPLLCKYNNISSNIKINLINIAHANVKLYKFYSLISSFNFNVNIISQILDVRLCYIIEINKYLKLVEKDVA